MKKICDEDCFNCKFEDCIKDRTPYKPSKEQKEKIRARRKTLYNKRKNEGICTRCGARKTIKGVICEECKSYYKGQYRKRKEADYGQRAYSN